MKIQVANLAKNGYTYLEKLDYQDLMPFLTAHNKNKGIFLYLYFAWLLLPISFLSYFITYNFMVDTIGLLDALLYGMLGIVLVLVFVPVHELLHALGFKLVGVHNISFYSNLKKFYFATVAHKAVVNIAEFKVVALLPFLTVMIIAFVLFPFLSVQWQVTTISFVAVHNLFCGGDFSLLNYLQNNKHRGIVTYDDTDTKETYFYVKK